MATPFKPSPKILLEMHTNQVLLEFDSAREKREFMGQLSDGWGENYCMLDWNHEDFTPEQKQGGWPFDWCKYFHVTHTPDV